MQKYCIMNKKISISYCTSLRCSNPKTNICDPVLGGGIWYGSITGRVVLYQGENREVDMVRYWNVKEYLRDISM